MGDAGADASVPCQLGEPGVRGVRVTRDFRVHQSATHDARNAIDERVMHDAIRDVHDVVRAQLEQSDFRGAEAAANGEP